MLETHLRTRLLTLAPNLYPIQAPTNYKTPCVVYNRIHYDPVQSLDGSPPTVAEYVFQIDIYDPSFLASNNLATTIRDNLVQWRDNNVQSATHTGHTYMIDTTTENELYRSMLTFVVFGRA